MLRTWIFIKYMFYLNTNVLAESSITSSVRPREDCLPMRSCAKNSDMIGTNRVMTSSRQP